TETIENPDYRDPSKAKYSESYWVNLDAVTWLVPPAAMTASSGPFPAVDYSGDFELITPPKGSKDDPKAITLYFLADFMSGMLSTFPKRARAILSEAVHTLSSDTTIDYSAYKVISNDTQYPVLEVTKLIGTNKYQVLVKKVNGSGVPTTAPVGAAGLFAIMEDGKTHLVETVNSQADYTAQDGSWTEPSQLMDITFEPTDVPDLQESKIKALAYLTESDENATFASEAAAYAIVSIRSEEIKTLHNGADADVAAGPHTTAAAAQTAINTYLGGLAGGMTCTVTGGTEADDWEWTIKVTGTNVNTNFANHKVVVDDANGNEIVEPFEMILP
ncbi:MAG: hypothetical protein R3324_07930, partial [Halobacteriales archaeon]|nr:hypothetical protein [Halobacteriales archaeon]